MRAFVHGEPPFAILVSLLKAKGMRILQDFPMRGALYVDLPSATLKEDQYHFVETVLEAVPDDDATAAQRLRAALDHLANAGGTADLSLL